MLFPIMGDQPIKASWFWVLVLLCASSSDLWWSRSGFLIHFSVLAVETLVLLLLPFPIIDLIGICIKKTTLRIKAKHLAFSKYNIKFSK